MTLRNRLGQIRLNHGEKLAIVTEGKTITFSQLSKHIADCQYNMPYIDVPIMIRVSCRLKAIILMLTAIEIGIPFIPVDNDKSNAAIDEIKQNFAKVLIINDLSLVDGQCVYHLETHFHTDSRVAIERFDNVMSVMFTSGSTGKPKGVLVPCSAVENLLSLPKFISLTDDEVFATYSSLSFDASTFEIFTPLLNGKRLVILNSFAK